MSPAAPDAPHVAPIALLCAPFLQLLAVSPLCARRVLARRAPSAPLRSPQMARPMPGAAALLLAALLLAAALPAAAGLGAPVSGSPGGWGADPPLGAVGPPRRSTSGTRRTW